MLQLICHFSAVTIASSAVVSGVLQVTPALQAAGQAYMHTRSAADRQKLVDMVGAAISNSKPPSAHIPKPVIPSKTVGPPASQQHFIVTMVGTPTVLYTGGEPGIGSTKPAPGQRLDAANPEVIKYTAHLRGKQAALAARHGVADGDMAYNYDLLVHGFAARLTQGQVGSMRSSSLSQAWAFQ